MQSAKSSKINKIRFNQQSKAKQGAPRWLSEMGGEEITGQVQDPGLKYPGGVVLSISGGGVALWQAFWGAELGEGGGELRQSFPLNNYLFHWEGGVAGGLAQSHLRRQSLHVIAESAEFGTASRVTFATLY